MDGARLILEGNGSQLINVERSFKVVGSAEIVAASCLVTVSKPAKANSPDTVNPYDRGPGSNGPGDATAGRSGSRLTAAMVAMARLARKAGTLSPYI
jgi:hypothetical protein